MRKIILLLHLAVILFPTVTFGQYDATTDTYTLQDSDVTVENGKITYCATSATDWGTGKLIIPETLNNQQIISIQGNGLLEGRVFSDKGLTEVFLPSCLQVIENNAFANNQIEKVHFSENSLLKTIMSNAFHANNISKITIPRMVSFIGAGAFQQNNLTSVEFEPYSFIRYIDRGAFRNNSSLASFELPINANPGFTEYRKVLYSQDKGIQNVTVTDFSNTILAQLPLHVLTTEDIEFKNNTLSNYYGGYMKIVVPEYMEGEQVKVLTATMFGQCIDTIVLARSIDTINSHVFSENMFSRIRIPSNVKHFGDHAGIYLFSPGIIDFENNSSLSYIGKVAFQVPEGSANALPNDVIKEGYSFSHWEFLYTQVYSIIENYQSYEAQFSPTTAYTVSGNIDIDTLDGVSLILTGDFKGYRYPENDKSYSFLLNEGRVMTITPQKEGYSFVPASRTVTDLSANTSGLNFTATQTGAIITGRIDIDNTEKIWLQISGDFNGTVKLQDDGTYILPVNTGRNITLTPIKDGYIFSPQNITINNAQGTLTGNDFETGQSYFMVSGNISIDVPENVELHISGDMNMSKTLQSDGDFSFTTPNETNISITPQKAGYVFSPQSISISRVIADTSDLQFIASRLAYKVSGTIEGSDLNNIVLQISGDTSAILNVETDGNFSFNILSRKSITITPQKEGCIFTPANRAISDIKNDTSAITFIANPATGINAINDCNISLFPNPANSEIYIASGEQITKFALFDSNGSEILSQKVNNKNAVLDIKHLPNGIYLVMINTNHKKISKMIIIE